MTNEVSCIVCDKRFRGDEEAQFKRLAHFEDAVLCHECLLKEREGASAILRRERDAGGKAS